MNGSFVVEKIDGKGENFCAALHNIDKRHFFFNQIMNQKFERIYVIYAIDEPYDYAIGDSVIMTFNCNVPGIERGKIGPINLDFDALDRHSQPWHDGRPGALQPPVRPFCVCLSDVGVIVETTEKYDDDTIVATILMSSGSVTRFERFLILRTSAKKLWSSELRISKMKMKRECYDV